MADEQLTPSTEMAQILIVEDDEDTADFLNTLLTEAGYVVSIARSGREALNSIETAAPDLILMDLMLPGLDGFAVTEQIRAGESSAVPIIMLTALSQPTSRLKGFNTGADDFVVKPFDASELLARISVQLQWSQSRQILEDQSKYLRQALEVMSRRQEDGEASFSLEHNMRVDLLRSVDTHLQALCRIFESEYRRQPLGGGREALLRVIPRLRGAALVYQIADRLTGATTDFDRLLRVIATSIKGVYSQQKQVSLTIDAGPLEIPSAIASPLAMIASELVTNAFKHAFPTGRTGTIMICCQCRGEELVLEVVDDGVGLPDRRTSTSRGLPSVQQAVAALSGTLSLVNTHAGTRATIRTPLVLEAAPAH